MSQESPYPGWSPDQPPAAGGWGPPTPPPPNAGSSWNPAPLAAPKPGVVPLRPLGLTEILDGAFTYIRRSPGVVLGISALVAVVSNAVQLLINVSLLGSATTSLEATDPNASVGEALGVLGPLLGGSLVAVIVALVFQTAGTGLLTIVMGRAVLGEDIDSREAWRRGSPLLLPLIGLVLLVSVLWLLGLVFCIIPGVFLYVAWSLAPAALMLEKGSVTDAMRRSWRLVLGSWWRVFGILLLASIIAGAVEQLILAPFSVAGLAIDGFSAEPGQGIPLATLALTSLGGVIATTITLPFSAGVISLLYIDQRMRREAFDLELMRATTRDVPGPASGPPPTAS